MRCKHCDVPTDDTHECANCWEVRHRIERMPAPVVDRLLKEAGIARSGGREMMKHTVPDCMKPDGGEPCRGYADLRKEWLSTIDAAHQAGEIHNNVRGCLERRIEDLNGAIDILLDEHNKLFAHVGQQKHSMEPMIIAMRELFKVYAREVR